LVKVNRYRLAHQLEKIMKSLAVGLVALILAACGNEEAAAPNETVESPSAIQAETQAGIVDPARIESALSGFVERDELVGVSALVYEGGDEAYFGAFGMADREAERPMRRDTLVQIYSMTKPLTGVTLMTLYEEGLFALDDPLQNHLPEFADIEVYAGEEDGEVRLQAPARPPTVRDIMRHTAGFANDGDQTWVGRRYREVAPTRIENTLAQMSAKLASVPLLYEPGTRWLYGPSVDVQARLVEVLSGKAFDVVMRERVLDPLGMTETQYTLRPDQRDRISGLYERHPDGSYTRVADEESLAFNLRDWPLKPGGWGLTSTLDDYLRFARMLLNEGELDGVRILKPETVSLMATDAMPAEVTDRSWLVNKGQVGFGIDFAVRVAPPVDQAEASGAVGEFFWDGAANTLFWVDPANDIAAVLFNHYRPFGKVEIQKAFRDAVYYRDASATALNKAAPGPDSRRLAD
jgi:CubicO group peptidase (beta-lactamase class C family)